MHVVNWTFCLLFQLNDGSLVQPKHVTLVTKRKLCSTVHFFVSNFAKSYFHDEAILSCITFIPQLPMCLSCILSILLRHLIFSPLFTLIFLSSLHPPLFDSLFPFSALFSPSFCYWTYRNAISIHIWPTRYLFNATVLILTLSDLCKFFAGSLHPL